MFLFDRQKIIYRLRYVRRSIWLFFGCCHRCHSRLNYTTKGRPICPRCGK